MVVEVSGGLCASNRALPRSVLQGSGYTRRFSHGYTSGSGSGYQNSDPSKTQTRNR